MPTQYLEWFEPQFWNRADRFLAVDAVGDGLPALRLAAIPKTPSAVSVDLHHPTLGEPLESGCAMHARCALCSRSGRASLRR